MRKIKDLRLKLLITAGYLLLVFVLYLLGAQCIFKTLFGIDCIGCGMTRAMISAIKLDFSSAFNYHAMFWSMPVLYLYFLFDGTLFKNKTVNKIILIIIALGFLAVWISKIF